MLARQTDTHLLAVVSACSARALRHSQALSLALGDTAPCAMALSAASLALEEAEHYMKEARAEALKL